MISFLKKDENPDEGKFLGKGDIVFLLVVAGLVAGFWFYTKVIKQKSAEHFEQCLSAYAAAEYLRAEECFEEARNLHYLNDNLDSIIYTYLGAVDSLRDLDFVLYQQADSLMKQADTAGARAAAARIEKSVFLDEAKSARVRDILNATSDSMRGQILFP